MFDELSIDGKRRVENTTVTLLDRNLRRIRLLEDSPCSLHSIFRRHVAELARIFDILQSFTISESSKEKIERLRARIYHANDDLSNLFMALALPLAADVVAFLFFGFLFVTWRTALIWAISLAVVDIGLSVWILRPSAVRARRARKDESDRRHVEIALTVAKFCHRARHPPHLHGPDDEAALARLARRPSAAMTTGSCACRLATGAPHWPLMR